MSDLCPNVDFIQELESSLQSINPSMKPTDSDSTTGEEKKFVKTLLDVQKSAAKDGLDFKTFCIVLALSEASEGLDVFLGSSSNKMGRWCRFYSISLVSPSFCSPVRSDRLRYCPWRALLRSTIVPLEVRGVNMSEN